MRERDYFNFVEPTDVKDTFVNGIARVEDIPGSGLARVWLYADEFLVEPIHVIRCKLVIPLGRAIEMNDQAGASFRAIHRNANPLRVVK